MAILKADYSKINHQEMAKKIGLNVKHTPILISSFVEESYAAIVKLQEAIEIKNYDEIHRLAHFIKGSAGNLHFSEVYEMCKEMEIESTNENESFDYDGYFSAIKEAISTIK